MDNFCGMAWRCIAMLLPVLMMIVCVGFLVSRPLYCNGDAVLMTKLLRNVTIYNSLDWNKFAEKLGFSYDTIISRADVDIVTSWIKDNYEMGPILKKQSVAELLITKRYVVEESTVKLFKDFESCTTKLYWMSTGALFMILVCFLWAVFGYIVLYHCNRCGEARKHGHIMGRIFEAKKRLRTCSYCTDDLEQAAGSSQTTIQNKAYGFASANQEYEGGQAWRKYLHTMFTPCTCGSVTQHTVEEGQETQDTDEPRIHIPGTCFHRGHDTTLQQSSIQQILDVMKSVGLLFNKSGALGSVVRVGSKYVITAWHVVQRIVRPSVHNFHNQPMNVLLLAASDIYIDFNEYCRQSPQETHFKILPKIVFVDDQWDVVILEISGRAEYLPDPVRSFSDVSDLNTTRNDVTCVHVIGQHPRKEIVVADMSCKILNRKDKRVTKAIKWTKRHTPELKKDLEKRKKNPNMVSTAYYDVNDTTHRLIFDTYLEFGGSGGAVMAFTTEGDLALVAILTHGLPPFRSFYTTMIPDDVTMEVGTTLNAIKDSLEWKPGMEKIKEDIFGMPVPMETDGQAEEMDTDERL